MRLLVILLFTAVSVAADISVEVQNASGNEVEANDGKLYRIPAGGSLLVATGETNQVSFSRVTGGVTPGLVPIGTVDFSAYDVTLQSHFLVTVHPADLSVKQQTSVSGWFNWGWAIGFAWFGFGWILRLVRQVGRTSAEI